jgi:glutathione S-transferase
MSLKLYYHPVSSYSQKTLMAFYEKGVPFEPVIVDLFDPNARAEFKKTARLGKVPYLRDDARDWGVPESSIIIEYIDANFDGGPRLIPQDPELSRQARFRDRVFDLYLMEPMTKIFFDGRRPTGERDPSGVREARETLDTMYGIIDGYIGKQEWAFTQGFGIADCAAAPALHYARVMHPFDAYPNLVAYHKRLLGRPSFQRVLKEAEPYMKAFT